MNTSLEQLFGSIARRNHLFDFIKAFREVVKASSHQQQSTEEFGDCLDQMEEGLSGFLACSTTATQAEREKAVKIFVDAFKHTYDRALTN